MKSIILGGLAAGAITVLICTSSIGEWVRRKLAAVPYVGQLVNCCFCTSWWVSIAMLDKFTLVEWAATVAVANITVLLIHLGIATVGEPEDEMATELVRSAKLHLCVEESCGREAEDGGDRREATCELHESCQ